jgi:hypothetical protein
VRAPHKTISRTTEGSDNCKSPQICASGLVMFLSSVYGSTRCAMPQKKKRYRRSTMYVYMCSTVPLGIQGSYNKCTSLPHSESIYISIHPSIYLSIYLSTPAEDQLERTYGAISDGSLLISKKKQISFSRIEHR